MHGHVAANQSAGHTGEFVNIVRNVVLGLEILVMPCSWMSFFMQPDYRTFNPSWDIDLTWIGQLSHAKQEGLLGGANTTENTLWSSTMYYRLQVKKA